MTGLDDPVVAVACLLAVGLGALVQGVLGFGLALLSVPVLALLAPELVPVAVLVAVLPLTVLQAVRERAHLDLRGLGWALVGRVPGGAVGALAVAWLPVRGLQVLVAAVVLLAVAASVRADRRVEAPGAPARARPGRSPRRTSLTLAGALSGVGGTTAGIGGPPMAIAYRNAAGGTLRATLATFFLVGALLSIGSLVAVGEVSRADLVAGAVLVPAVLVGYVAAAPLRRRLAAGRLRRGVLGLSAVAGTALLAQAALG
ncbi:sulfite exporter TauE/SafE family protein [Aquipuribacter nitratireducens]|uniref:Probable membrane transporter protein n=1 Tax=Aquipuribacter nitratireducens TaxID=650104 RepID=A0ABW0GM23_9MICO